jgi:hypothetical protein
VGGGLEEGNRQTNSVLGKVTSGVNFELMMARREIYVYPIGELTIVERLRVGVIAEMFYGGCLLGEGILEVLQGY